MSERTVILRIVTFLILTLGCASAFPTEPSAPDGVTGFSMRLNVVDDGIIGPNCKGQKVNASMMISAVESCTMDMEMDKVEEKPTDKPEVTESSTLCVTACLWKKLGLVGKDMMFTQDVTPFVIGTFPPKPQPEIMDAMTKCAANNKWPVSMEDNCNSYGSMRKCIMDAVVEICKGS